MSNEEQHRGPEDELGGGPEGGSTLFPAAEAERQTSAGAISAVRELAGTPKRVSVLVGRRRVAVLLATQAMELGLAPGVVWTDALAVRAARLERVNAAKAIAMRRLAARARSRVEILEWLGTKGVESDIAAEAVERLAEIGLISDGQVEEDERRRAAAKGLSGLALSERLAARGIGANVEGGPASGAQNEGDAARALEIARAELLRRPINPADVDVLARRVMGILARKGYEEDVAREAVVAAFAEHGLRIGIESAE